MIRPYGELRRRRDLNAGRLSADMYAAPQIFEEGGDWPGDWQGRAILALCCHWRAADDASARAAIMAQLRGNRFWVRVPREWLGEGEDRCCIRVRDNVDPDALLASYRQGDSALLGDLYYSYRFA